MGAAMTAPTVSTRLEDTMPAVFELVRRPVWWLLVDGRRVQWFMRKSAGLVRGYAYFWREVTADGQELLTLDHTI